MPLVQTTTAQLQHITTQTLVSSAASAFQVPQAPRSKGALWQGFENNECAGLHQGARDYCAPAGTTILAPYGGTFVECGEYTDPMRKGKFFRYTDFMGYDQYFGHLAICISFRPGDPVKVGDVMGTLANFYNPDMGQYVPHTHWQVKTPRGDMYDPKILWESR